MGLVALRNAWCMFHCNVSICVSTSPGFEIFWLIGKELQIFW